jgi:hypothetical protein
MREVAMPAVGILSMVSTKAVLFGGRVGQNSRGQLCRAKI